MTPVICWQYRVKKIKETECAGLTPHFDKTDVSIEVINYEVASKFILEYEWLGNMGTSKYCYGLFLSGQLACVACYGPPVAPARYSRLLGKENSKSILQLCRGASAYWAPRWTPSKLISISLKLLSKYYGTRGVVAYADPLAGEIGTIYQACNALYLGLTKPGGGKRYIIKGHAYDPRKVHKRFGSRAHHHLVKIDPDYKSISITPKHRYLFLLGERRFRKEMTEKIKHLIQPYPKRAPSY